MTDAGGVLALDLASSGPIGWAWLAGDELDQGLVAAKSDVVQFETNPLVAGQHLALMGHWLSGMISLAQPGLIAVEDIWLRRARGGAVTRGSVTTYRRLAEVAGEAKSTAALHQINYREAPPATIRAAVMGNGHATKDDVMAWVTERCGYPPPETQDEADALLVLAWGVQEWAKRRPA